MRRSRGLSLPLAALAALAGCTPGAAPAPAAAPDASPRAERELARGMVPGEVRARWGEPDQIRPRPGEAGGGFVWTYRRVVRVTEQPVPVGTVDVPAFDPLSGRERTEKAFVYSQEWEKNFEVTELVFIDGELASWSRSTQTERKLQ